MTRRPAAVALMLCGCSDQPVELSAAPPPDSAGGRDLRLVEAGAVVIAPMPRSLHVADLDGDGAPEIIVGHEDGRLRVLRATGGGRFEPAGDFSLLGTPRQIVPGSFDRRPGVDLVVATGERDVNYLETFSGAGDGTLLLPPRMDESAPDRYFLESGMAAGDLDGDGITDLVAASPEPISSVVFLGNGDGTLSARSSAGSPFGNDALALRDLDGDDILDLAATAGEVALVHHGNGDGTFEDAARAHSVDDIMGAMVSDDFNGDGNADLLALARQRHFVTLMLGAGDGEAFTKLNLSLNLGPLYSPVAGDLDGDHLSDVALLAGERVVVLLSDGTSLKPGPVLALGGAPFSLAVADMDGDRRPDLVVGRRDPSDVTILQLVAP
ncbi:FG-GAP-like repeat-containing protein [Sorangium sp. So ce1335]|uniref:FG-GAP repeat domain-containing protein n=1 Tax=Sorangium sp. So ce1335 TaxID=3133335 RepID=UPI003F5FE692